MNIQELINLKPREFKNRVVGVSEILTWFDACDAYWAHDGDSQKPHAELTSGLHSNAFFDCLRVLKYVNLSEILANQLAKKIRTEIGHQKVDWVIASPMAGITFGHDVARALGAKIFAFTEKGINGSMVWGRMSIPKGETVLQIEELITTSKTLNMVQEAIDFSNQHPVKWLPYIGALVHRPTQLPVTHYGDRKLVPLIEKEVWAIKPEECQLCRDGSPVYRPKINWQELTGKK